ncbi:C40 family peptidase [Nesterenkonia muleiensis]|uniref:C40 family peptidase n=1 Tax=Nesterenkonia muleiensis TaxID=2282648 RepID=UPI000E76B61A|nr:C40 family peptidase [Nesterenkonia muleiensis]
MTDNNTFVSRRERRAHKGSNAGAAGRTTAAVLASAGLVIGTGVAANATDASTEGRAASTVEVSAASLTVERASVQTASVVSAPAEVSLSFERPSFSSQSASEPEPQPEPETQAEPASSQEDASEQQSQSEPAQQQAASPQGEQAEESQQQSSGSTSESSQESSSSESSSSEESAPASGGRGSVVSAAYSTLGTPHVMGGTTPGSGIDCSGMIQYAYAQAGISVPRTTHAMASLPRVSSPQPGDIVLSNGNSHGGIYIGNGQVISTTASQGVRVHGLHDGWHNVTSYHRPGG